MKGSNLTMYTETVQAPRPSGRQLCIGIAALLCLMIALSWGVGRLAAWTGWGAWDALPIAFLGVLAYTVYRHYTVSYRYTIMEEHLILEQLTGELPRLQLSVRLLDIQRLEASSQAEKGMPTEQFMPRLHAGKPWMLADCDKGKRRQFRFQPSDALVERLEQEMAAAKAREAAGEDEPSGQEHDAAVGEDA